MAVSKSRRAANDKWDKENMTTIGCKLKKDDATAFKEYCAAKGITPNTELKEHVLKCIGAKKEAEE